MEIEVLFGMITAVIIVSVVVGTIGGVVKRGMDLREKRMELEAGNRAPDAAPLLETISAMEKRLRNLERIATDDRPSLSAEIEALRLEDERAASAKEKAQ